MIRLQRNIEVATFEVEATVALSERRPEYLAVLRLAADLGRPLTARDVHRQLFGNLPETVGRIVLDRCSLLGLFDRTRPGDPATLSSAGALALERGGILLAEEGLWRIYHATDPLLGARPLHVQRLVDETNAQATREVLKKQRGRPQPGAPVPEAIRVGPGTSLVDGRPFEIRELSQRGGIGAQGSLRLHLEWSESDAIELALRGTLPGSPKEAPKVDRRLEVPAACKAWTHDRLWLALTAYATRTPLDELTTWHTHTRKRLLPRVITDLDEATRRTARCELTVPACRFPDLGTFEATRLADVDIVPRAEPDAQAWAEWLQWDGLSTYTTPTALQTAATAIAAKFPYHRPRLPTPQVLLQQAIKNPADPRARFLLAPADLGLWS